MAQESPPPTILGISGGEHDAAAALLRGTELVAALEEEKLARVRRARGLPSRALQYCLQAARLKPEKIDYVALARPLQSEGGERAAGEAWGPEQNKQEVPARQ